MRQTLLVETPCYALLSSRLRELECKLSSICRSIYALYEPYLSTAQLIQSLDLSLNMFTSDLNPMP